MASLAKLATRSVIPDEELLYTPDLKPAACSAVVQADRKARALLFWLAG